MTRPQQIAKAPWLSCGKSWTSRDCLLVIASCCQPGHCSETLSLAAGLFDVLFGLCSWLPPPSSLRSFLLWLLLSQPPSTCTSLCCIHGLLDWSMTQPGMSVLYLVSPAGSAVWWHVMASYLEYRAVISTCSWHFSEACLVLLERCLRIPLMVNNFFPDFRCKLVPVSWKEQLTSPYM